MFACPFLAGCTVTRDLTHVVFIEPLQFPANLDHYKTKHINRMMAREALANCVGGQERFGSGWWPFSELLANHHGLPVSPDYADGFIDGFSDHLTYGGGGLPPLAPPRRYWKVRYANPVGREAVQAWYAGFTDGAATAMSSGVRDSRVIPASVAAGTGMLQRDSPPSPNPSWEEEIYSPLEELPDPTIPTDYMPLLDEFDVHPTDSSGPDIHPAAFQPTSSILRPASQTKTSPSSIQHDPLPEVVRRLPQIENGGEPATVASPPAVAAKTPRVEESGVVAPTADGSGTKTAEPPLTSSRRRRTSKPRNNEE